MGDYPSKKSWRDLACAVIQEGIDNEDLRDELLCQVIKQVINNQRRYGTGLRTRLTALPLRRRSRVGAPPPPRFGTRIAWPPPGPTSESLLRGWYLLNLCVGSLPPSDHLFPYLRQFLLRTVALEGSHPFYEIAVEAQAKLERTRLNGPRQYPPIALEIDCVEVHVFAHDRTRGRPGSN